MQKIRPFLWFDDNAEEAVSFYTTIFEHSKIVSVSRYGDSGPGPKGTVMVINFELDGEELMALNGGPKFKFSPAISLLVNCKTQEEIDRFWVKLSEGGKTLQCGWLQDKFGVSWQVVPTVLGEMMLDKDPRRSERVMSAIMEMNKIDIAGLKRAYEQAA